MKLILYFRHYWKLLSIIVGLVVFLFIGDLLLYQRLINEGSRIADAYCIEVNPVIIARKEAFIKGFTVVRDKGESEDFRKFLDEYYIQDKEYVKRLKSWLTMQREYMDRWDYKLIIPEPIQTLTDLQHRSREADYNQASIYLLIHEKGSENLPEELTERMHDEKQKSMDLEDQYNTYWEKNEGNFDIRNFIIKLPESTCPPENRNIPDTDLEEIFYPENAPADTPVS